MRAMFTVTLLGLLLTACQVAPQEVEPVLSVSVAPKTVKVGESLQFTLGVSGNSVWHVALFVEDATGEITQLLPNRLGAADALQNTLQGGQPLIFPSTGYTVSATGPTGQNTVLLMLMPKPPVLTGLSEYANAQDAFARVIPGGVGALTSSFRTKLQALNGGNVFQTATFTVVSP